MYELFFVEQAFQPAIIGILDQAGWKACPTGTVDTQQVNVTVAPFFPLLIP